MSRPAASDQAILDGAQKALDRHGWQHLTIERVAEEAGLSRATLHRRGVTKEELLGRLGERAVDAYRKAMWPVLTAEGDAVERLERALAVICELAEANLNLLLALDAHANAAIFHSAEQEEALTRDVFTEPLDRLLRDGAADGTLRPLEPLETATVLFNLVGWTYIHLRSGHHWPPDRAKRATLEIALGGVAATS